MHTLGGIQKHETPYATTQQPGAADATENARHSVALRSAQLTMLRLCARGVTAAAAAEQATAGTRRGGLDLQPPLRGDVPGTSTCMGLRWGAC
eukprot:scaffold125254_cov45-Phaeocystis_antarctica.AAC.1